MSGLVSIYDGTRCLGFILSKGKLGFQAITANEKSLGLFTTHREAVNAVMASQPWDGCCEGAAR